MDIKKLELNDIAISELNFADYNPRQLLENQFEHLKSSIEKFGFVDPIIVNRSNKNTIVGGHQRVAVAKKIGIKSVPVIFVDLSPDQERELNIRLNANTGEWNFDMLANNFELPDLKDWGFDINLLGDIEDGMASGEKDERVPSIPDQPQSKLGEIYQLGENRVMCGDSTKMEDVEKLMDGEKANMVFTDPPYALFGNGTGVADVADDKMIRPFFRDVGIMLATFTKPNAHIYSCLDWRSFTAVTDSYSQIGLTLKNTIIWDKESPALGAAYRSQYEMIIFLVNQIVDTGKFKQNAKNKIKITDVNVWKHKRQKDGSHNAQKPIDLISRAIKNSTLGEDELVLDLFLGSGSTLIAAQKMGRKCYGMELEPKFVDVTVKRWCEFTGQTAKKNTPDGWIDVKF